MWFQTQLKTRNSSACVRQILPYQFTGWSEGEANYQQLSRSCLGFSVSFKETQAPTLPAMSPCCPTHANRRKYEEAGLGKYTDLLFAFRKRGSSRADTEYRVVISGGWYGISPSSPSGSGVDSTSVSSGKLKERSLQKKQGYSNTKYKHRASLAECGWVASFNPYEEFLYFEKALDSLWILPVHLHNTLHTLGEFLYSHDVIPLLHGL